jgi:predicted Fe-Mo cluster-binding NifX family protein/predicted DNA-binding protein (UPF0251 family)
MVKPRRCRFIGRSKNNLQSSNIVRIESDEIEALRLYALEGLHQHQSSDRMGVSRATFGRILKSCMRKVAHAIVESARIEIVDVPWVVKLNNQEETVMEKIIAIPVLQNSGDPALCEHFGRTQYFAIVKGDPKDDNIEFVSNSHDGTCMDVAGPLKSKGVEVLLVKGIGRKAKVACDQIGIEVYQATGNTLSESIKAYYGGSTGTDVACGHDH